MLDYNRIVKFLLYCSMRIGILLIAGLCLALLGLLYQSQFWMGKNPIVRARLNRIEPFQDKPVVQNVTENLANMEPDVTSLEQPREPYALLKDVLQPLPPNVKGLTAESCYGVDFQTRLEKTGNFRQLTNNYKRGTPDSCSTPDHGLLAFYKPDPVA